MNKLLLDREKAARLTFGFALLILVDRYFTHSLVYQMQQPVLSISEFDYTYWIYHFIRFPEIFVQNKTGAVVFDSLLLISTVYNLVTAANNRGMVLICSLAWTLYCITFSSYACHFFFNIHGIMVLPYVFLAKKDDNFRLAWDGARYICLFTYVDAFVHKAFIGRNLYYFPTGEQIIKTNQMEYMLHNPGSTLTSIFSFFISHPALAYIGFVGMVLLQGSMALGFFTKKWDKYLFFVPIVFHTINYVFVDVFFFELLILNLTFLPLRPPAASRLSEGRIEGNPILQSS